MAPKLKYYDLKEPTAFGGKRKFLKRFKKVDPDWFNSQDVYTLHKPKKKKIYTRSYRAKFPHQFWQADLNDMISISNENDNFKYILTVVDVFSRFAMALPLKFKTGTAVTDAFEGLFKAYQAPKYIHTDEGKEFENYIFRNFLKNHGVEQFSVKSVYKAGIVERFNRTLKEKMFRYFTHVKSKRWVDVLPQLIETYNRSYHRTIKMSPKSALRYKNKVFKEQEIRIHKKRIRKPKLKSGDIVRLSKVKNAFEKGYTPNWTKELFQVIEVDEKYMPVMYRVADMGGDIIQGKFYDEELQYINNHSVGSIII